MLFWVHHIFFRKFHLICDIGQLKFWWQTSVKAWSIVLFAVILNCLKTYIYKISPIFVEKSIPNYVAITFTENKF